MIATGVLFSRFLKCTHTLINYHKLLAAVIFVAQKYVLDLEIWSLADFGAMAGLTAKSLRKLELVYLQESKFNLFVHPGEFEGFKMLLLDINSA